MRIISGKYGGLRLKTKIPKTIRPTEDKTKESIFNTLANIYDFEGLVVADLCSGTGSLGIEAISRGVSHCVFVEKLPRNLAITKSFLSELKADNTQFSFIVSNALSFTSKTDINKFDIILTDPPYEADLHNEIANLVSSSDLLSNHGILVIEHKRELIFDKKYYNLLKIKEFGATKVSFLEKIC